MEKLSSPISTFDFKFAKFLMSFVSVMGLVFLIVGELSLLIVVGISSMIIFGAIGFYLTVWCVVDEVEDFGDYLVFKKNGNEQKVLISEIKKLDHPFSNFKGLIRVHVNKKGSIGKSLTFRSISSAPSRFSETKVYKQLLKRIDRATAS